MSIRAMVWALDTPVGDTKCKLVLIALADHADDDRFQCWPLVDRLAKRVEFSRRTVYRCLDQLEQRGFIKHEIRRADSGWMMSPLFTLLVPTRGTGPSAKPSAKPSANKVALEEPSLREDSSLSKKEGIRNEVRKPSKEFIDWERGRRK